MKFKLIIFKCLLIFTSMASQAQESLNKLTNKADFDQLSGLPLSDKYGQVSSVKVVYDIQADKLYFINSKFYKYHYDFCSELTNAEIDLEYFNKINYSSDSNRSYLLANINYYQTINKYALEISPADMMSLAQLIKLSKKIQNVSYFDKELNLLLNSARLLKGREILTKELNIISPDDIYLNLNYQAISKYKNNGRLRFIKDFETEKSDVNPKDIIVIDQTPIYLPIVSGIIVTEFQTPLSHLTILGQNRKIPICAFKSAFNSTALKKYENQKIILTVKSDTFNIEVANDIESKETKPEAIILMADLSMHSLIDAKDLDKKSIKYAGNKAANFGLLYKISQHANFKVPESAFAIPFYFYNAHIEKSLVKGIIYKMLHDVNIRSNKDSLEYYLALIRSQIENTPLDTALLKTVYKKVISLGNNTRLRFRSSTNAEDAKGFSGAGLYSSVTGILNSFKKPIDKAIREVWASLWSYEAFSEREYYNLSHEDVYMGILVHRSFPSEGVNGVAITKNLYRAASYGFVVNAQLGDEKVVKPKQGNTCDQFICYPNSVISLYNNKNIVDVITISNLNNGNLIMSESEIKNLANQLEIIKEKYINHTFTTKSYLDFGLDVEFKLDGDNRDLYVKQVRVYND